jgi:DNA-binding NtrC family response regulator
MTRKVLIVDDDKSVRESLSKVLRQEGYEVALAADGSEALEKFDRLKLDLVLLDLSLPVMNGWEIFEHVTREDPLLPVIIVTGQANQYGTAATVGAGALMEKPLDILRLLRTMKRILTESREARLRRLCGLSEGTRQIPRDIVAQWRRIGECEAALRH